MSIIKITGSGAYEHTQETNHSLEYLKRTLTEHKIKPTLDHPDGSVTEEKLSTELRDRMSKHESDIQELNEKKADKSELDTKADKTTVYTKSETDTILSTKADKATTYTIAQTDTILSTKADKADVLSLQELATLNNEHVMTHDTDIRNLTEDKANKTDVYFLQQWCDNLNENKADRSELPTKVSQLENDKNYVTQEETESFVHSDTLASDYYSSNYIDNIVNEVSNTLSTKADKADLDWKLIGEEEVTEADITAAGETGVTAVTIDFGKPIDSWYSETMVITAIPISSAINNFTNGKLCVLFGKTEEGAINRSDGSPALVASQGNNALLTPAWNQQHIITSNWLGKKDLTHSYVNYRGYNAATGYTVSPYTTESWSNKANPVLNCRYLAVIGSYNVPNTNPVEKIIFKFPAGSKISIYGRM